VALPCFKNFPVGSTSFLRRPFKGSKENLMDDLGHMKKLESWVIYIYIYMHIYPDTQLVYGYLITFTI